jgi:hypothetical protein
VFVHEVREVEYVVVELVVLPHDVADDVVEVVEVPLDVPENPL